MKQSDMVKELVSRIRYNQEQFAYYRAREDEAENPAMWSELRSWYEGRISAFNIALMMVDPEHPMVVSQIPNNSGAAS